MRLWRTAGIRLHIFSLMRYGSCASHCQRHRWAAERRPAKSHQSEGTVVAAVITSCPRTHTHVRARTHRHTHTRSPFSLAAKNNNKTNRFDRVGTRCRKAHIRGPIFWKSNMSWRTAVANVTFLCYGIRNFLSVQFSSALRALLNWSKLSGYKKKKRKWAKLAIKLSKTEKSRCSRSSQRESTAS